MKPMKFRKKPVVIEAYQTDKEITIQTLEGAMKARLGDWIITGVNGEEYPCKPDTFEKTYEQAGVNQYVKIPIVIDAYQTDEEVLITTSEGTLKACVGDWIITGVNGEKYPCKPDIFEKTYEKVETASE